MRNTLLAAAALGALLLAAPAAANDSTAELRTGGLVLTKTGAVEMRSEDLFISAEEIRVRYVFRNTSGQDVTTVVAFPMPDLEINGIDDMIAIPTEDPENILGFATKVDGADVRAAVEQQAVLKGKDYTAYLKGLGLPVQPHTDEARAAMDALPQARRDELVKLGLATPDEFDAGKGWETHWRPSWTLKTTYHWTQTFPAGKDVVVEHRYKPSVGASAGTGVGTPYPYPESRAMMRDYCIDQSFMAAVNREKAARKAEYPPFTEQRISYVLKTGANWKKPIGDFKLTIDKGSPDYLLTLCIDGIRKTGPTTFEVRKTNFTPTRDIAILILQPYPAETQP